MGFLSILVLGILHATAVISTKEEELPPIEYPPLMLCNDSFPIPLKNAETYDNGSVYDPKSTGLYPEGTYWKNQADGTIWGCPCKLERPCLWKCCPPHQAIDSTTNNCTAHISDKNWFKPVVQSDDGKWNRSVVGREHFVVFNGDCGEGKEIIPEGEYILRGSDGSMELRSGDEPFKMEPDTFCVDYAVDLKRYVAYRCTNDTDVQEEAEVNSKCKEIAYIIYPIGMCISVIFLIISFFVYACIPELRNLHGKCLLCHIASLMTAYMSLVLVQAFGSYISYDVCHAAAFIIYFALLSTFLWLNIMCIDMCVAFSGMRAMNGTAREREGKKFILYMLYAWGLPLVPLGISLYLEFGDVPSHLIKPMFRTTCWFQTDEGRLAYFIGPVGTIITVNIALFIFTANKIFQLKKQTKMLKKSDSRRHSENDENTQRFNLYLKLFIVMGVNWALEIISWFIGGSDCIWIPADLFNTLQGLFIFVIFVWKAKIRRTVGGNLKKLARTHFSNTPTTGSQTMSLRRRGSAQGLPPQGPGSSSSDGRSICTASSTVADGDIKMTSAVANSNSSNVI